MKRLTLASLAVLAAALMISGCAHAQRPDGWRTQPVWEGDTIWGESCYFVRHDAAEPPRAPLLFTPLEVLEVKRPATGETYTEGVDYTIDAVNRRIELTSDTAIPWFELDAMYPAPNAPNAIAWHVDMTRWLRWGPGDFFHRDQIEISYRHAGSEWSARGAPVPTPSLDRLPVLGANLEQRTTFTIAVLGDSISVGAQASGWLGVAPHQPDFVNQIAEDLTRRGAALDPVRNFSVGGKTSVWGLTQIDAVIAAQPHLVMLGFGMNDSGGLTVEDYAANMAEMVSGIRTGLPDAEFVLIATMTPNPEWSAPPVVERFLEYRDALNALADSLVGVVVADVTSTWLAVRDHKTFWDVTSNGVNHPNDFGHRLYAQVILATLSGATPAVSEERP